MGILVGIGNELTACFLSAAAIALWIANERRSPPTLGGDALAGLIFGLALLTKASAAAPLAALLLALAIRARSSGSWRRAVRGGAGGGRPPPAPGIQTKRR